MGLAKKGGRAAPDRPLRMPRLWSQQRLSVMMAAARTLRVAIQLKPTPPAPAPLPLVSRIAAPGRSSAVSAA